MAGRLAEHGHRAHARNVGNMVDRAICRGRVRVVRQTGRNRRSLSAIRVQLLDPRVRARVQQTARMGIDLLDGGVHLFNLRILLVAIRLIHGDHVRRVKCSVSHLVGGVHEARQSSTKFATVVLIGYVTFRQRQFGLKCLICF